MTRIARLRYWSIFLLVSELALLLLAGSVRLWRMHLYPGVQAPGSFFLTASFFGLLLCLVFSSLLVQRSLLGAKNAERRLSELNQLNQNIMNAAGQMIVACDLKGTILAFNAAAERMLGYQASEMIGQDRGQELFPEGELERVGRSIWLGLGTEGEPPGPPEMGPLRYFVDYAASSSPSRVPEFELQFLRKDGSIFPAIAVLSVIRDGDGTITGLLGISSDITARKRAEHALRESEDRYRDLFEHSREMIATLSPRGRYLYVNPSWQSNLAQRVSSLDGQMFEIVFPEEFREQARSLFTRALNGETVEADSLFLQRWDGSLLEVHASLSCRRQDGMPVSVRCICRDITEEKQRERRLALELAVSELLAVATSETEAYHGVKQAVLKHYGWDSGELWLLDDAGNSLTYGCMCFAPGKNFPNYDQANARRSFKKNDDLPGKIWATGKPLWIESILDNDLFTRYTAASADGITSVCGIPVRVRNEVIAVLAFSSVHRRKEDKAMLFTLETACAPLGQFVVRSQQERRVRELDRQQASLLHAVADGIFGVDPEGRVQIVNPAGARMLGITPSAAIGRRVHDLVHEHRADNERCSESCRIARALLNRDVQSGQEIFFRKDGSGFPVEFSATPILEQSGDQSTLSGVVISFRDVTQRHALDKMKDEFISTVSHELRTPLTSIRGALGLLSTGMLGKVEAKAANLLRIAVTNTDRLVRLINDILDLERMDSGRAPLHFRRCNLADLVQQAVETMSPMADAAAVKLEVHGEAVNLDADSDRMLQVLTNLLSNAIKFSPDKSTVTIKVAPKAETVVFSISDQGRGIPVDKLENVFDRFQQVDASDSRQKGGTGLGLAICRSIVQQHGGSIWAERNPDRGVSFHVQMPRTQMGAGAPTSSPVKELRGSGTVLVCDDDPGIRTIVGEHLRQHGYTVVEADRGEQALVLAAELDIQAILLDLYMPGLSGWETLQRLRNTPATANIPVVVLSVLSPTERPKLAGDADGWVQKPFNETLLLSELGRVLHGSDDPGRILLVEDDNDLASVVTTGFEQAGIQVDHASTLEQAIEHCRIHRPDLIILDLRLPDGDGFSLVDWLRQNPDMRTLPLVVYSGHEVSEEEMGQLRLGPTQFLTKAKVQPKDVEALVLTMVRHFRERTEPATSSTPR